MMPVVAIETWSEVRVWRRHVTSFSWFTGAIWLWRPGIGRERT